MSKKSEGARQNVVLRASGVSHALWPSQVRRCLATGKIAQRRRLMIIKGVWWFRKPRQLQNKQLVKKLVEFQSTFRIYLLYTTLAISLLVVGILLAMFVLHPWPITILLVLLWVVTTALTMRLWYTCLYMTLTAPRAAMRIAMRTAKRMPKRQLPTIAKTRPLPPMHTVPVTRPQLVTRPSFPSTPIPPTPLVRVLETIDLSTTSVEHFLSLNQTSDQQVPQAQRGSSLDGIAQQADKHMDVSVNEENR
jgi:hypothetical protein